MTEDFRFPKADLENGLDHREETQRTWNEVAKAYEEMFMDLSLYDGTYDRLLELMGDDQRSILELGLGPGNISRFLSQRIESLNITGIDYSAEMISLAREHLPSADLFEMDVRELDSLNALFDVAVCGFLIPYLSAEEVQRLASDVSSKLNPGGLFYLSYVTGDPNDSGLITGSTGHRTYFYYHDQDSILRALFEAGLQLVESSKIPSEVKDRTEDHMVIIARKG